MIVVVGHGVQGTPNGYVSPADATAESPFTPLSWTVWAPAGTTFVQGTSALLNIAYTFIGQALIPSFVGDMAHPEDFPKALYLSMSAELLLFTICGAVVYCECSFPLVFAASHPQSENLRAVVASSFLSPHRNDPHHRPRVRISHQKVRSARCCLHSSHHHHRRNPLLAG